jgi:hypothetical protein
MEMPALATRMSSLPWRLMRRPSPLGRLRVGDVEADDLGLAPLGLDRVGDLARGGLALHVVDDDRRALLGERLAARATDAARAAGDERDLSVESNMVRRRSLLPRPCTPFKTRTCRSLGASGTRARFARGSRGTPRRSSDATSPTLSTGRPSRCASRGPRAPCPGRSRARGRPLRGHEADALFPAHGPVDLAHEQLLHARRRRCSASRRRWRRSGKRGAHVIAMRRARRHDARGGRHQRAVERGAHLERDRFGPSRADELAERATAAACPATTICPGALKFAGLTTSPSEPRAHSSSSFAGSIPITAPSRRSPAGPRPASRRPRARTRRTASSSDSAPAATRAEYSPSEWPRCANASCPCSIRRRNRRGAAPRARHNSSTPPAWARPLCRGSPVACFALIGSCVVWGLPRKSPLYVFFRLMRGRRRGSTSAPGALSAAWGLIPGQASEHKGIIGIPRRSSSRTQSSRTSESPS